MRDQEIIGLWEAYHQVYAPQEITEEVEIAAQYFYEMGLNEDGVDILIEELGVEEFAEFVYDIAEEYVLTEARAGGVKIEPVTASGKPFKSGKPTGKSLQRLRAQKAERKASEEKTSESKPSGLKASLQRQSAVSAVAKKQPKKPGLLDRVAGAVSRGIERHNKAMGELQKMKSATAVTAGKVKKAAGEFKKGLTSEEVELAERKYEFDEPLPGSKKTPRQKAERKSGYHSANYLLRGRETKNRNDQARTSHFNRASTINTVVKSMGAGQEPHKDPAWKNTIAARRRPRASYEVPNERPGGLRAGNTKAGGHRTLVRREEFEGDLFDYLIEYLVAEGYADTNKAALAIMANMSEEWKASILDEATDDPIDVDHKIQRLPNNKTPKPTPQQVSAIAAALKLRARAKKK